MLLGKPQTSLCSSFLIDIHLGAPNYRDTENDVVKVKSLRKGGLALPYVSGQAFRRWLRDTIEEECGDRWTSSPLDSAASGKSGKDKEHFFSSCRPDKFAEDDLFGYMKAVESGSKGSGTSTKRTSVLRAKALLGLAGGITEDFMTRRGYEGGKGAGFLGKREVYSSVLQGGILIPLPSVGRFMVGENVDLTPNEKKELEETPGIKVIDNPFLTGQPNRDHHPKAPEHIKKQYLLPLETRVERVSCVLESFPHLRGGAKQGDMAVDIAPRLVILAFAKSPNDYFTDLYELNGPRPELKISAFAQRVNEFSDRIISPIWIGYREGFLNNYDLAEQLKEFKLDDRVKCMTVTEACQTAKTWLEEHQKSVFFVEGEKVE
jgi:CRISPR-associated protein Cst2